MKSSRLSIIILSLLVLLCIVVRIQSTVQGWYNFAPIGALALISGAVVKDWRGRAALAVLPLLLSDLALEFFTQVPGFYGLSQVFVYAAVLAVAVFGSTMRTIKPVRVLGYAVGGSLIFFLVSNLGYWAEGHNGHTLSGLIKSYVDAVPFYRGTLVGDMVFATVLFGGWALAMGTSKLRASMPQAR